MKRLDIGTSPLSLGTLRTAWQQPATLAIDADAAQRIAAGQAKVEDVVAGGAQVYGVNTGFGQLAQVRISDDELQHLQENLVRSHAVGVGDYLSDDVVRLVMVTKAPSLSSP